MYNKPILLLYYFNFIVNFGKLREALNKYKYFHNGKEIFRNHDC